VFYFRRTVMLQCASQSVTADILFGWKGISLTIYCFPFMKAGNAGQTNQVGTGVKQCSQITSLINTLEKF
jgi:ABC-type molybdate transport system permease subunit